MIRARFAVTRQALDAMACNSTLAGQRFNSEAVEMDGLFYITLGEDALTKLEALGIDPRDCDELSNWIYEAVMR